MISVSIFFSFLVNDLGVLHKVADIKIHTGGGKVRRVAEGAFQVDRVGVGTVHLHNGKQKLLRLVQPRQDLVFGDGNGLGTLGASLHLDKPQAASPLRSRGGMVDSTS